MTLKYFTANSHSWQTHITFQVCNPKHVINIFFESLFDFCTWKQKIKYHSQKSTVFKIIIAINGILPAQPMVPMVLNGFSTIGDDGFRWLPTIGPTMRW